VPYVSEGRHSSRKESGKGPRFVVVKTRTLMNCLFFMGGAYLAVYGSVAFCSDGPIETPARSTSTAQSAVVAGLTKRAVTVADSIQMTRLGNPSYTEGAPSKGIVAKFSPDGERFVIVLKKGNLAVNTNEYSLVLFQTSAVFQPSPEREVLASLASSSNRPAINNVLWLDDNDTILFLGERPGEQTELYSVTCSSKEMRKLTNHSTSLTSFVTTARGAEIVFTAKSPGATFLTDSVSRKGIVVTSEWVTDLIRGSYGGKEYDDDTLSMKQLGRETETKIVIAGRIGSPPPAMSLSPDGAYLLLQTMATHVSDTWNQYEDKFLLSAIRNTGPKGSLTNVYQYELVDMGTGASQVLVDAPIGSFGSEMAWSPDSKSVVVSDVYLPLDDDPAERALRKAHTFLVEFKIPSRQFVIISHEDLKLVNWDPTTGYVACDAGRFESDNGKTTPRAYFRKSGETWSQASTPGEIAAQPLPDIVLDEGMNTPPRIVAIDPHTGRKSLLMDLNPQLQNLALARVEEIAWKAGHGTEMKGGLYWPPDYVPGKKYPLILQTHGWNPERFWMDGPYTTAFAAQSLAGKGFFVLQVPDPDWHLADTPKEVQVEMAAYESAIDYLDRKGLIDRNRVGITGFSRTYWYVTYTLTHSKDHFAAAAVADGVDYGYFQYMAFSNLAPALAASFEDVNGAPPFGKGLRTWLKRSPSFLMDKIQPPLRVQALNPSSLLSVWGWYTGLSRLGKPAELIYLPEGTHILEKPWERMISQQGNVDWFCFWLKGEEDPDPAKAEQYKRWREFRRLKR
jgi:hypothetical protein